MTSFPGSSVGVMGGEVTRGLRPLRVCCVVCALCVRARVRCVVCARALHVCLFFFLRACGRVGARRICARRRVCGCRGRDKKLADPRATCLTRARKRTHSEEKSFCERDAKALEHPVQVLVYAELDSIIEIDRSRQVLTDFSP